jgi:tetratricopeptide (TPR) repeat protein
MSETPSPENTPQVTLEGQRVTIVGRLAGMNKRDAKRLVREHGGVYAERPGPNVDKIVLGEGSIAALGDTTSLTDSSPELVEETFDDATCASIHEGKTRVVSETQFWDELGLVDFRDELHQLYTPAMLAELLGVPISVIRRWHRRGLIVPKQEVHHLPYFDFQEVVTARHLAQLMAAGVSPAALEKKLAAFTAYASDVDRPLAQLSVLVEGRQILLRSGDGLVEPSGQRRFDFDSVEAPSEEVMPLSLEEQKGNIENIAESLPTPTTPDEMIEYAAALEESGQLAAAAEAYRAAMAAAGPTAELCFQVAEILYRLGDKTGARERLYMAIELDEDYVEARANLGCILAECGEYELAVAAFQGAIAFHDDYADVHLHLARALDHLDRKDEAQTHWESFLRLAPGSPSADEARARLEKN